MKCRLSADSWTFIPLPPPTLFQALNVDTYWVLSLIQQIYKVQKVLGTKNTACCLFVRNVPCLR